MARIAVYMQTYNYEDFIRKSLDSLLGQTYGDFVLYIADNGSSDDTCAIIAEYARKDTRIIADYRKGNGKIVNDYIAKILDTDAEYFVRFDADDWIEPDYLEYALKMMEQGADLAIGSIQMHIEDHPNIRAYRKWNKPDMCADIKSFGVHFQELHQFFRTFWAKMYRTSIMREHGMFFKTDIGYGSDTEFVYRYATHCRQIALTNKIFYHYRVYSRGAVLKYYEKRLDSVQCLHEIKLDFLRAYNMDSPENLEHMQVFVALEVYDVFCALALSIEANYHNLSECDRFFRKDFFSKTCDDLWKLYLNKVVAQRSDIQHILKGYLEFLRVNKAGLQKNAVFEYLSTLCPPIGQVYTPSDVPILLKDIEPIRSFFLWDLEQIHRHFHAKENQKNPYSFIKFLTASLCGEALSIEKSEWAKLTGKQKEYLITHHPFSAQRQQLGALVEKEHLAVLLLNGSYESLLRQLPDELISAFDNHEKEVAEALLQLGLTVSALLGENEYYVFFLKAELEMLVNDGEYDAFYIKHRELSQILPDDEDLISLYEWAVKEQAGNAGGVRSDA